MATTQEVQGPHGSGVEQLVAGTELQAESPINPVHSENDTGNRVINEVLVASARKEIIALLKPGASEKHKNDNGIGTLTGPQVRLWFALLKKEPQSHELIKADLAHPKAIVRLCDALRDMRYLELSSLTSLIQKSGGNAEVALAAVKDLLKAGFTKERIGQLMVDATFPWTHISELLSDPALATLVLRYNGLFADKIVSIGVVRFKELHDAFSQARYFKDHRESSAYFTALIYYGERYATLTSAEVASKAVDAVDGIVNGANGEITDDVAMLIASRASDHNPERIGVFLHEIKTDLPDFYAATKNFEGLGVLTLFPLTEKDSMGDVVKAVQDLTAVGFKPLEVCQLAQSRREAHEANSEIPFSFVILAKDAIKVKKENPHDSFLNINVSINTAVQEDKQKRDVYKKMDRYFGDNPEIRQKFVDTLSTDENFAEYISSRPDYVRRLFSQHGNAQDLLDVYNAAVKGAMPLRLVDYPYMIDAMHGLPSLAGLIDDLNATALTGGEKYNLLSILLHRAPDDQKYLAALVHSSLPPTRWETYLTEHSEPIAEFEKRVAQTAKKQTTIASIN